MLFRSQELRATMWVCASPLIVFSMAVFALADEGSVVAEVNYDAQKPIHQFSYAFAGYGDPNTNEAIQIKDQLDVKHAATATAGKEKAGGEAKLDASRLNVPDSSYDYAGWALGLHCSLEKRPLPSTDISEYRVSFDAKVTGTTPLLQSKFTLHFVTADGNDEGDMDDSVLILCQGQDDGTGCLTLTSNYKTFSFDLDDMDIKGGAVEKLKGQALKGINFIVQAQGSAGDIGADADKVLQVDNFKLIKKK